MSFNVQIDIFRGPLDLLLYLVRKHEVQITDIPIRAITDQYLAYLEVLEQLDVNAVGDFLDLASTLIEIKSRMVLPRGGEEEGELEDPRQDLVERLLEYKKFRDAASLLEDQSRSWQQHFARQSNDLPPRKTNLAEQPIHEVELWDLVSAFGRILREHDAQQPSNIVYDDTPIHVYMQRILEQLAQEGRAAFWKLFEKGMHKSSMIGIFLAVLELVRHHDVQFEQDTLFGEIWLYPGSQQDQAIDVSKVDYRE
ncbi:MAG: segregation/condensation protein A [Planctomycetales bacterium]|nr:segregation/condensation protein A [Planctomycetales bacterium]NIP70651.1 segregation/condensation protein A [Planctomycetales bacterium]